GSGESFTGNWNNTGPLPVSGTIRFDGTLTNTGEMLFTPDNSNTSPFEELDQRILIPTGTQTTMTGAGRLTLSGFATGVQGEDATSVLVNTGGHEITGAGQLGRMTILNTGGVISNTGAFRLEDVSIDGGMLSFVQNATVDLDAAVITNAGVATDGTLFWRSASELLDVSLVTNAAVLNAGSQDDDRIVSGTWANTGATVVQQGLTFSGDITNSGEIAFQADASNGGDATRLDQRISIPAGETVRIGGSGRMRLAGVATGVEGVSAANSVFINENGHTIVGNGRIQRVNFINTATVMPDGNVLFLDAMVNNAGGVFDQASGTVTFENTQFMSGDLSAEPGAGIAVRSSTVSGATITGADGTTITITGSDVTSDLVTEGGLVDAVTEMGQTLTGGWTNTGSTTLRGSLTYAGVLLNTGELRLSVDASNGGSPSRFDSAIFIAGGTTATMTGGGSFALSGFGTGIEGEGQTSVLLNTGGHTITGQGTVQDLLILNTGGTITNTLRVLLERVSVEGGLVSVSEGQEIALEETAISNAMVEVAGTLRCDTLTASSMTNVDLRTLGGELFASSETIPLEISGTWMNAGETLLTNAVSFDGDIENLSILNLRLDASNNGVPELFDQRLAIPADATTTISGAGVLRLAGVGTAIQGAGAGLSTLVNSGGHAILGNGNIADITVQNEAVIAPDGVITLRDAAVSNAATGRYQFRFAAPSTRRGRLTSNTPFVANGTIDLGFIDGFVPNPASSFVVVSAPEGVSGVFSNAVPDGTGAASVTTGNATFTVVYLADEILVTDVVPASGPNPDFNRDAVVDIFDVIDYLALFDPGC
ncbi:MAG: hypothetical protein AAF235_09890, partial [Planctomycetota bacterium]